MAHLPLTLPCLRGNLGKWIYYSCLMPMSELAARVSYAEEIHTSQALSDLIQRSLEGKRAEHIATYLRTVDDRFFGSLVLATYGGSPEWFEIGNFKAASGVSVLADVSKGALDTIGMLRLAGKEKIFALDGQHRLAGIRKALKEKVPIGAEMVPVLLVGHKTTKIGNQRTRRLFTTLNKTAIAVKKSDIIALDEDDVMAITARRLVEEHPSFAHPKIAVIASANLPHGNSEAIITISALYDILKLIFNHANGPASELSLRFNRPSDQKLDEYYKLAVEYLEAIGKVFKPVGDFMASDDPKLVASKMRTANGGHVLFRVVGWDILTRSAILVAKEKNISLKDAIGRLAKMPVQLSGAPYCGTIWDPAKKVLVLRNKTLARKLIFHMLGLTLKVRERQTLLKDYRAAQGVSATDTAIKLPAKIV
jgi:DNA sulfur modification protein DndB